MKLIHIKTNKVILEFSGKETIIYDKLLEEIMKEDGILIPSFFKQKFNDKSYVFLGDSFFQQAFKEAYFPFAMKVSHYRWEK
jgi:hypothetical protein